jgi:hydroxylamine dehydrogenase
MRIKKYCFIIASGVALLLLCLLISPALATEQYAAQTGKGCTFCHQESIGGPLNTVGFAYINNGYHYPIPERMLQKAEALQSPFHETLRFIIGYLHLLAAVVFFGAIFYIHIFIRPVRLIGGIPKYERILGVSCMMTLALTGTYLTWARISRWGQFFDNTFGLMLFIKILLFLLMVAIGVMAITFIHRHMQQDAKKQKRPRQGDAVTIANLSFFDGSKRKRAYVVYAKRIYDVTASSKWKGGRHLGRHRAGMDLTEDLKSAPHGPEVLEKVKYVGELSEAGDTTQVLTRAQKTFIRMAYINLVIIFLILGCISVWRWGFPLRLIPESRADVISGATCIACHRTETPGIYHDWKASVHAKVGVDCYKCHQTSKESDLVSASHLEIDPHPIAVVVTPKTCSSCHPKEAAQYAKSKHAHTYEIMWKIDRWLNDGMNNAIERTSGCYACHGSVVKVDKGKPIAGSWPNVGVGRKNPDDSLGSCSSCHTRHKFSIAEARRPEACDQCHLGPDHPQIEIYNESKHGTIYHAEGTTWNWIPDDRRWQAGRDYRAPTCAVCHMSAATDVPMTHDVTERLAWELQAPLTVRPSKFAPFPAKTTWATEREKMKKVCLQCHAEQWVDAHFVNLDEVVNNYNDNYFKPIKGLMDSLYKAGLLSNRSYFDEELEWDFYELWHHEGRRARMGAAMMAPDYAWWHGFYELKHRFIRIMQEAEKIQKGQKPSIYKRFPGCFKQ